MSQTTETCHLRKKLKTIFWGGDTPLRAIPMLHPSHAAEVALCVPLNLSLATQLSMSYKGLKAQQIPTSGVRHLKPRPSLH